MIRLYNNSLGNIFVKSSLTTNLTVRQVKIPSSVTSIGYNAFYGCTGLTSIKISENVTNIGNYAFYNWTSNQTIYIKAESKPEGWSNYWNENCNANIVWGYQGE